MTTPNRPVLDPDSVAETVADLARRLGAVTGEPRTSSLRALLSGPLERWADGAGRSRLGDDGLPLELSVKDTGRTRTVRCTVDPLTASAADAALTAGTVVEPDPAGPDDGLAWATDPARLVRMCLQGAPAGLDAPLMLGIGIGDGGLGRTTVYARTSFWTESDLDERLPGPVDTLRTHLAAYAPRTPLVPEVVGVDYVDGRARRWKTYHWLQTPVDGLLSAARHDPDLQAAAALCASRVPGLPRAAGHRLGFLQVAADADGHVHRRMFLFLPSWGWSGASGLATLLTALPSVGAATAALPLVRDVLVRRGLSARLSMVALGRAPDVTYYLLPGRGNGHRGQPPANG